MELEPVRNLEFRLSGTYKTLSSASDTFSMDYYLDASQTTTASEIVQYENAFSVSYFPGRKMTGYGVERHIANDGFPSLFAQVTRGDQAILNSDFDYTKVQFSYIQPWHIGPFGRLTTTLEAGKTFGEVPLGLLNVVPGSQSYFSIYNTFSQLDYYEFVTDTYTSLHLEHNFNGRFFSRIPFLRKYNLREIVGFRGVWGEISQANRDLNASGLTYMAPTDKVYYEYSFGIGNIFKVFRIDFNFRGNYHDTPDARNFGVTGSFGFVF